MNYLEILPTVRELLQDNGRMVQVRKLDGGPTNTDKPWQGSSAPRGHWSAQAEMYAVFVDPTSASRLGFGAANEDLIKACDQVAIAEPPLDGADITGFHEMLDEGQTWSIIAVQKLKPGDTTLLYFVWVKR